MPEGDGRAWVCLWRPCSAREAAVSGGGGEAWVGGVAPLRHAGGCSARGRRQGLGGWCGAPSACGRLRCPRVATRPGWVVWRPFGMREAVVPEGGGRAWPGFEPTRRAEGSRRGRRAGGPPPSGTDSGWEGRAAALGHGEQSGRWAAALGHGEQLGRQAVARGHREEGRCGYRSPARPFLTARSRW